MTDIWTFDPATNVYAKQADNFAIKSESTKDGDNCKCNKALKEVEYTFQLEQAEGNNLYSFNKDSDKSKITARVVLYADEKSTSCGSNIGVQQSFKISFKTTAGLVQKRSGNPGYMDGYPLKIATQPGGKGQPMDAYVDGFQITGADKHGKCILDANERSSTADPILDFDDPVIKFKTDLSYGCSLGFSEKQFESFCKSSDAKAKIKAYEIFKNLDEMGAVGRFGNADILYPADWLNVNDDASFATLGDTTWFDNNKTCKIVNSVQIKVVYHEMGYNDHPQRYIIDVTKFAKEEFWQWPAHIEIVDKREIDFDFFVNVQHVDYEYTNQDEDGFIPVESAAVDKMMFYPAFLRSLSQATNLRMTLAALATSAMLLVS